MPRQLSSEEIDVLARRRAGAKLGWYVHACVYVLVNLGLYAISDFGFGHRTWSRFPVFGWGIGLALHGISVFLLGKGSAFRERMVDRERERLQRDQDRR